MKNNVPKFIVLGKKTFDLNPSFDKGLRSENIFTSDEYLNKNKKSRFGPLNIITKCLSRKLLIFSNYT